jgi:hypothetical protein
MAGCGAGPAAARAERGGERSEQARPLASVVKLGRWLAWAIKDFPFIPYCFSISIFQF